MVYKHEIKLTFEICMIDIQMLKHCGSETGNVHWTPPIMEFY